jgi:hypothetical protein
VALALAASPAVVSGSGTTVTTASYTPTANSLLVALVAVGNPPGTATATTGAVTDSLGSTWTMKRRQNGTSGVGSAEVWMLDIGASPAARTITLTGSKSGVLLAVLCITGAQSVASQTGATAVSATTNANTISITPTATGSYIVGVASETVVNYAMVAATSTTVVGALNDASNGGAYGAWRSTNTTTVTTAQTYGVTPAPTNETEKVAVEVLASTGGTALTTSAGLSGSGTLSATTTANGATYRMYAGSTGPTASAADPAAVSVGVEFYVTAAANLTEIRWWQATTGTSTSTRQAALYTTSNTATPVATATAAAPTGTGWQTLTFATPVALTANTRYKAVVYHPGGQYANTGSYYASGADETNGPLVIPKAANTAGGQGTYNYATGLSYPASTFQSATYWVDVTVATGAAFTASAGLSGSGSLTATVSQGQAGTPKVATLTDNYSTQDTAKWSGWGADVAVSGGRLGINATSAYPILTAAAVYDLTGSSLAWQMTAPTPIGNTRQERGGLRANGDATNILRFTIYGGTLYAEKLVNTTADSIIGAGAAYDAATMAWFRIREASGTTSSSTGRTGPPGPPSSRPPRPPGPGARSPTSRPVTGAPRAPRPRTTTTSTSSPRPPSQPARP